MFLSKFKSLIVIFLLLELDLKLLQQSKQSLLVQSQRI